MSQSWDQRKLLKAGLGNKDPWNLKVILRGTFGFNDKYHRKDLTLGNLSCQVVMWDNMSQRDQVDFCYEYIAMVFYYKYKFLPGQQPFQISAWSPPAPKKG